MKLIWSFQTTAINDAKQSKLYASFFLISRDEIKFEGDKINEAVGKRTQLKGLEDKVCGSYRITSIRIAFRSEINNAYKH